MVDTALNYRANRSITTMGLRGKPARLLDLAELGVETARTGQTGMGFAVVATEVRALAQRNAITVEKNIASARRLEEQASAVHRWMEFFTIDPSGNPATRIASPKAASSWPALAVITPVPRRNVERNLAIAVADPVVSNDWSEF